MRKTFCWMCVVLLAGFIVPALHADVLDDLARDFWAWRAAEIAGFNDET